MKTFTCFIIGFIFLSYGLPAQTNEKNIFLDGQKSFEKKNYKKAFSIFSGLIDAQNKNPEYYLARAKCLHKMDKMQESYNDYNMAVKLGNMTSIYYYERGLFLENLPSQITEAIDNFTMAKNYADNDSMIFNSLYHRATLKNQIRDFDNAGIDFRNAFIINPKSIALLNDMAMFYNDISKTDSSIMLLKNIIQLDSTFIFAYQNLAFVYSVMEKFEESLEFFNKCFVMNKTQNSYLYNNRGYVKLKLKDFSGALKDVNKSLKMNKTNSYAFRNRALIFIEKGNIKKACLDIDKALQLNYTQRYGEDVKELYNKHCR